MNNADDGVAPILAQLRPQYEPLLIEGPSLKMISEAVIFMINQKEPETSVLKLAQRLCETALQSDEEFLPRGVLGMSVLRSGLSRLVSMHYKALRSKPVIFADLVQAWCDGSLLLNILPARAAKEACAMFFRKGVIVALDIYAIVITACAEVLSLDDLPNSREKVVSNAKFPLVVEKLWDASHIDALSEVPPVIMSMRNSLLDGVDWIGFDLDFTLIEFHERKRTELVWQSVAKAIRASVPSPDTPVRAALLRGTQVTLPSSSLAIKSCAVDVKRGNLLKLDEHGRVNSATHGSKPIDVAEIYGESIVSASLATDDGKSLVFAHTEFELPLALAFAALVDEVGETHDDPAALYTELLDELRKAFVLAQSPYFEHSFQKALQEPAILTKIAKDQKKLVRPWLEALRRSTGKRLFVVTDAKKEHVELLMAHTFGPGWLSLFEFVVTDAKKGGAFFERTSEKATGFARGLVVGGSFDALGITEHDRVLFFGDHAVKDVMTPKRRAGWQTVGVLSGLEEAPGTETKKTSTLTRMFSLSGSGSKRAAEPSQAPALGSSFSCENGLVTLLSKEVNDHAVFSVPSISYCATRKLFLS